MMQAIMWVILGATVAAAALVDRVRVKAINAELGDAVQLDGISVRMPQGWALPWRDFNDPTNIVRIDPRTKDLLVVSLRPALNPSEGHQVGEIPVGDEPDVLTRLDEKDATTLRVRRVLADGSLLSISLTFQHNPRHFGRKEDLIKRVAASVKVKEGF